MTAFLGTANATGDGGALFVAACVAFAFCGLACAAVLAPWTFTFVGSIEQLIADRITGDDAVDLDGLRWAIAQDLERWRIGNKPTVRRLWWALTCASAGFVVEVVCLLALAAKGTS